MMRSHSYFGVISVFILLVISEAEAWHSRMRIAEIIVYIDIEHAIIAKIAENYANKQSMVRFTYLHSLFRKRCVL